MLHRLILNSDLAPCTESASTQDASGGGRWLVTDITGAGLAVAGGAATATLQNANGVVLHVQGPKVGFSASLNLSGLTIAMQ